MCGSEARLCKARWLACSVPASLPYVIAGLSVTVPALRVDDHVVRQLVQAHQHVAVGDLVERMPRTDHPETRGLTDELPKCIKAAGRVESVLTGTRRCRPSCAQPPAHRRTTSVASRNAAAAAGLLLPPFVTGFERLRAWPSASNRRCRGGGGCRRAPWCRRVVVRTELASDSDGDGADVRTVQPGAPGESVQELSSGDLAAIEPPRHNAADTAFMQHMIVHHSQAVQMAALVDTHTESDDVSLLAERIAVSTAG